MVGIITRSLLRCLIALSIAFTPLLPLVASAQIGASGHAAHVQPAGADSSAPQSGKHAHCNDHCCFACGMMFLQTGIASVGATRPHPVQVPVTVELNPDTVITVPHRPPRTLS